MNEFNYLATLSIVSHGQANLIKDLLNDLDKLPEKFFEVIITINLAEDESLYQGFSFPIRIIRNSKPKGFGCNHNAAFNFSSAKWFAVVNPDIRVDSLDISELLSPFEDQSIAAIAPLILSKEGKVEDSARRFPTLFRLIKRVVFGKRTSDYGVSADPFLVDWVAGMFVVFRRSAYKNISGFDDRRFFMYLEDADICRRLKQKGLQTVVNPKVQVVHLAQRASRKNFQHMRWHIVSTLRFLTGL
ncbi:MULTISPECIES: glycosyltransferase [Comamonas]|uniref:glycosyltransferase n=1 Tax=Comamonas TaxID=283 RepID=UPI0009C091A9|nr:MULTISPECIES: glycosyltransferase [Comamonas]